MNIAHEETAVEEVPQIPELIDKVQFRFDVLSILIVVCSSSSCCVRRIGEVIEVLFDVLESTVYLITEL